MTTRRSTCAVVTAAMLMVLVVIAGCSGNSSKRRVPTGLGLVVGRSHHLADLHGPGIDMPRGSMMSLSIGKHYELTIKAADWDTIVATSHVRVLVGVEFAPNWNTKDYTYTTRNRFQYLANVISQHYDGINFEPLSIAPGISKDHVVEDAALYNPTYKVAKLSGLKITIINRLVNKVEASKTFYSKPIIIPGRTVYYAHLIFPSHSLGPVRNGVIMTTTNFHYSHFVPCRQQVCS